MNSRRWVVFAVALITVGCGETKDENIVSSDDANPIDAGRRDAGVVPVNPPPAAENVSGAGSLTGGSIKMDIQIGHPLSQEPTSGNGTSIEANSAIKR